MGDISLLASRVTSTRLTSDKEITLVLTTATILSMSFSEEFFSWAKVILMPKMIKIKSSFTNPVFYKRLGVVLMSAPFAIFAK